MRDLAGLARLAAALVLAIGAAPAHADTVIPTDFVDELVGAGLVQPVNFDFLPDGRVLLVERSTARIRLVVPGTGTQVAPVGTIPDVSALYGEQGLLGIAVDPRWPAKPYVYVHHTCAATPNIKVVRYALTGDLDLTADGTLALDSLSRREVLSDLPSDFNLHNGGTLEFGPDGCLYVALGDDGIRCLAQDPHQLRGKILRLDVRVIPDGPGPVWPYLSIAPPDNPYPQDPDPRARLVWHRGLRNPWTFDIEPNTGRMAIADVGQDRWEEVSVADAGGKNFGWPLFEGTALYDSHCGDDDLSGLVMPIHTYPHPPGSSASIILAGICFAADDIGESFPSSHWGNVFIVDLFDGKLRRLAESTEGWHLAPPVPGQPEPETWGTGFTFAPRLRFGPDGGLWYVNGSSLHRIRYTGEFVDVTPDPGPPGGAVRLTAFPSPTRGAVTVEFTLAHAGAARLEVFDVRGQRVRTLGTEATLAAGVARRTWDGRRETGEQAAPGLYFVRLEVDGEVPRTRRLVVVP